MNEQPDPPRVEELLDEENLAVLAILLAVSLECGFGFAKTVDWWVGLLAGPAALAALIVALPRTADTPPARPTRTLGRSAGSG